MDDPLLVRGVERGGDLHGECKRLVDGDPSVQQAIGERLPVDQLRTR
jgi:hypothetical protein